MTLLTLQAVEILDMPQNKYFHGKPCDIYTPSLDIASVTCKTWLSYNILLFMPPKGVRPTVSPSVTNRVSAISHKLLEQI